MTRAAKSVGWFGMYLAALGILLAAAPRLLLGLVGLAVSEEVWLRLVGMLLLILGFFYIQAARAGYAPFFRWTLVTRGAAFFFVCAFVLWAGAPWVMLVFWLGDLAGALWTLWALWKDGAGFRAAHSQRSERNSL